jgi:hypothetical protein
MAKVGRKTTPLPMRHYYFKSLRARLTALLVIPVSLILLAAGLAGFRYARDRMLSLPAGPLR